MMFVILTEIGHEVIERTEKEWMALLGHCGETSAQMIDAMKDFLKKMWYARPRN